MSTIVSTAHLQRFTDLIRQMLRLRPRLKTVLPEDEDAMRLIARLVDSHPQGVAASLEDLDQLYNFGLIFAEHPEPLTMGELSQALNVPLSTATRMVDWLVKNDYAMRQADPDDRRVVRVTLTLTGQSMYQAGNTLLHKRAEFLLRHFTPAERESLVTLLTKLLHALEQEIER